MENWELINILMKLPAGAIIHVSGSGSKEIKVEHRDQIPLIIVISGKN